MIPAALDSALDPRTETPGVTWNGIDGATGAPLFPATNLEDLARMAFGASIRGPARARLERWVESSRTRTLGPKEGVDPRHLEEAGWGVIFPRDEAPGVYEALEPLLARRRRQANRRVTGRYKELRGRGGVRPGESKFRFLARHGIGPSPADPDRLPYYLLLVGDPEEIPYAFQYQLGVQYAVGRIHFDTPEEYAAYARAVVDAETRDDEPNRSAVFFGVREAGDRATEATHDLLVRPLAEGLRQHAAEWSIRTVGGASATKARLGRLLGEERPEILFTACHGLGFRAGSPVQRERQGGLVCAPMGDGDSYFTAADVPEEAGPSGLISFHFACYSAGTPRDNDFRHYPGAGIKSERAFIARLPQRLLAHPRGGALAVVGHVERAWTYSFHWPGTDRQLEVYASTFRRLLAGHPLGSAMEYFSLRYAELECGLADLRRDVERGAEPDFLSLGHLWTACNDARNFVILGDPAVRCRGVAR